MKYDEIVSLAKDVGLNDSRARVAAAIAMAESGGNPSTVVHDSDDDSYGLWQINMKGSMGPDRRRTYGLPNNDALLDPRRNAMVMSDLSQRGGNFSAWTTYTSGKYRQFLDDKSIIDKGKDLIDGASNGLENAYDNTVQIGEAAGTIAATVKKTAVWISDSKNWIRVAYITGGALIILAAVNALVGNKITAAPKKAFGTVQSFVRTKK